VVATLLGRIALVHLCGEQNPGIAERSGKRVRFSIVAICGGIVATTPRQLCCREQGHGSGARRRDGTRQCQNFFDPRAPFTNGKAPLPHELQRPSQS
jgi:hypothetical protein